MGIAEILDKERELKIAEKQLEIAKINQTIAERELQMMWPKLFISLLTCLWEAGIFVILLIYLFYKWT